MNKLNDFNGVYYGRKVLVTGHTGFKGSWLTTWLTELGANIVGYSLYHPSNPSHFQVCRLENVCLSVTGDVCDYDHLKTVFKAQQPEIVFHLAAQPIVRRSFRDPKPTFDTNVGGTINVLECSRLSDSVRAVVIITSDKCYRNVEWEWGYRENDELGGDDPYSASKGCAELVCRSYIASYFSGGGAIRAATARAGNVIGGGDWADDRIIPDCIRAFAENREVIIRNSTATRPWQHVLEPLSGYLWLGSRLIDGDETVNGQAFNFGPQDGDAVTVRDLVKKLAALWGEGQWREQSIDAEAHKENTLLRLNCDKASQRLSWRAILSTAESIGMTAEWYKGHYRSAGSMRDMTIEQVKCYGVMASERKAVWKL